MRCNASIRSGFLQGSAAVAVFAMIAATAVPSVAQGRGDEAPNPAGRDVPDMPIERDEWYDPSDWFDENRLETEDVYGEGGPLEYDYDWETEEFVADEREEAFTVRDEYTDGYYDSYYDNYYGETIEPDAYHDYYFDDDYRDAVEVDVEYEGMLEDEWDEDQLFDGPYYYDNLYTGDWYEDEGEFDRWYENPY